MEKASTVCRNMKQMNDFKLKVRSLDDFGSDYNSSLGSEGDLVGAGFSWPPRSYVCSFCKREFRSAQALGGHMNVHRRDRARLRQSPPTDGGNTSSSHFSPPLNLNLEPNPSFPSNPSLLPSSSPPVSSLSTKFPQFTSKLPPPTELMKRSCGGGSAALVQSCRPITADLMKVKTAKGILDVDRFDSGFKKAGGFVRLDLEIGLISPSSKEELDLELRLGYT